MPLECAMICLDTSNYMRNGDLHPTRLSAQQQSVSSIARFKLDDNLESSVGLLTMAGHKVDVHLSPCRELHKLLNCVKTFRSFGAIDVITSLKVSQLTLRNRSNKNQRQRIIMYIGSPIVNTDAQLIAAGKELKKNNVALDLVLFGYESFESDNVAKAQLLIDTAQSNASNSSLVLYCDQTIVDSVDEKYHYFIKATANSSLGEVVMRSPIGRGVISLVAPPTPIAQPIITQTTADNNNTAGDVVDEDEDADLLAAMALSLENFSSPAPTPAAAPVLPVVSDMGMDDDDDFIDEELRQAIALSILEDTTAAEEAKQSVVAKKKEDDDDDFNAMLESVSGGGVTEDKKDDEKKD